MTVRLTRQQQFDQALMTTCHGIARCVHIAMQGLGKQRREPLSKQSLVAAYTVGRHFAESMRIPMQERSDGIPRRTPFSPEVPRNHLGYLHAGVRVVNNAWTDDAGEEAMELLLEAMADAGVQPPPPPPQENGAVTRVVCPLGPPVYAGSSTATQAPSPGRLQGRAALSAPWSPSSCRPSAPWADGPVHDNTTSA